MKRIWILCPVVKCWYNKKEDLDPLLSFKTVTKIKRIQFMNHDLSSCTVKWNEENPDPSRKMFRKYGGSSWNMLRLCRNGWSESWRSTSSTSWRRAWQRKAHVLCLLTNYLEKRAIAGEFCGGKSTRNVGFNRFCSFDFMYKNHKKNDI